MSHDPERSPPQRTDALHQTLAWLSAIPVALIVVLTFADVLGRYIFSSPIKGSVEIIEFAMAMVIFTALPLVTRQRGHVTVSLIDNLVQGPARRIKMVLCDGISALALGVLTWRLYLQGREDLESGSATIVLGMPHAPLSFVLTFFSGLTTLLVLVLIWRTVTAHGDAK
jgi:TRAP-type C4-dicarboxylate transport system permease small subunit